MNDERSETIRKQYLYRRMIMRNQVRLPVKHAARLIGPDCAYHLYRAFDEKSEEK